MCVYQELRSRAMVFAEEVAKLFKANGWTWFMCDGERMPSDGEIWSHVLGLINELQAKSDRWPDNMISAGRIEVRVGTGHDGSRWGSLSLVPLQVYGVAS